MTDKETYTEVLRIHGYLQRTRKESFDNSGENAKPASLMAAPTLLLANLKNESKMKERQVSVNETRMVMMKWSNCTLMEITSNNFAQVSSAFDFIIHQIIQGPAAISSNPRNSLIRKLFFLQFLGITFYFSFVAQFVASPNEDRQGRDRFTSFRYTITDTEEIKYEPAPEGSYSSKPRIKSVSVRKLVEKMSYSRYPGNFQ